MRRCWGTGYKDVRNGLSDAAVLASARGAGPDAPSAWCLGILHPPAHRHRQPCAPREGLIKRLTNWKNLGSIRRCHSGRRVGDDAPVGGPLILRARWIRRTSRRRRGWGAAVVVSSTTAGASSDGAPATVEGCRGGRRARSAPPGRPARKLGRQRHPLRPGCAEDAGAGRTGHAGRRPWLYGLAAQGPHRRRPLPADPRRGLS